MLWKQVVHIAWKLNSTVNHFVKVWSQTILQSSDLSPKSYTCTKTFHFLMPWHFFIGKMILDVFSKILYFVFANSSRSCVGQTKVSKTAVVPVTSFSCCRNLYSRYPNLTAGAPTLLEMQCRLSWCKCWKFESFVTSILDTFVICLILLGKFS